MGDDGPLGLMCGGVIVSEKRLDTLGIQMQPRPEPLQSLQQADKQTASTSVY